MMRLSVACIALITISGCQKAPPAAEETPEATPEPTRVVESTPTPAPATPPPVVVATPVPDPLAPEGVVFLLTKASISTDDGIIGLPPGTRLERVSPGSYKDIEGHVLPLEDRQVTNNLRLARAAAGGDARAQAALRQTAQQQEAAVAKAQHEAALQTGMATPARSGTTTSSSGSKSFDPRALGSRMKDGDYVDDEGRLHYRDSKGVWHTK